MDTPITESVRGAVAAFGAEHAALGLRELPRDEESKPLRWTCSPGDDWEQEITFADMPLPGAEDGRFLHVSAEGVVHMGAKLAATTLMSRSVLRVLLEDKTADGGFLTLGSFAAIMLAAQRDATDLKAHAFLAMNHLVTPKIAADVIEGRIDVVADIYLPDDSSHPFPRKGFMHALGSVLAACQFVRRIGRIIDADICATSLPDEPRRRPRATEEKATRIVESEGTLRV